MTRSTRPPARTDASRPRITSALLVAILAGGSLAAAPSSQGAILAGGSLAAAPSSHAAMGMTRGSLPPAADALVGITTGASIAKPSSHDRSIRPIRPIPTRPPQPSNLSSALASLARDAAVATAAARSLAGRPSLAAERANQSPAVTAGLFTHVRGGTTFVAVSIVLGSDVVGGGTSAVGPGVRAGARLGAWPGAGAATVTAAIARLGGRLLNQAPGLIEADLPADGLPALAATPGALRITPIRRPLLQAGHVSAGVAVHGADAWQQAGYDGTGVRIGVIDGGFSGISERLASEFPGGIQARCYTTIGTFTSRIADCESSETHGTAVAETLADMAPGATLYIADPISFADTQQTIAWMTSQGVKIINASFDSGAVFEGPGDGTSPYADSFYRPIEAAVKGGALWVNSAGNSGDLGWSGPWADANANGWLDFAGTDETNALTLRGGQQVAIAIRWNDPWGAAKDDYDLSLYQAGDSTPVARSTDIQAGTGDPVELIDFQAPAAGTYEIQVSKHPEAAARDIQLLVEGGGPTGLAHEVAAGTLPSPADSGDPGMITVGAVNVAAPDTVETYSSRGPTADGRTKPDLVASDCAATTIDPQFCGTSQAAPYVAGAAALLYQAQPTLTPAGLADALRAHVVPLGSPIPNDESGWGRLALGPPPYVPPPALPPAPPPGPPPAGLTPLSTAGSAAAWRALATGGGGLVHVALATQTPDGERVGYRRSTDGGATFADGIPLSASGVEAGYAAIAAAGPGVHAAWLEGDLSGVGGVVVWYRASLDAGASWTAPRSLSPLDGRAGNPAVAADASGHVLIAWTDGLTGKILASASADGGATFSAPRPIGSTTLGSFGSPAPLDGLPAVSFGTAGLGYVAWSSSETRVLLRRTTDGGATWLPVQAIDRLADGTSRAWLAAYGTGVAVGYAGRLGSTGRSVVFVRRSADGGTTWAARRTVAATTTLPSFDPAVAARGPVLRVAFAQCTTTACTRARLWYRQSADGGTTWTTPVVLTGSTTFARPVGLAAVPGRILLAYESASSSAATRGTAWLRIR